MKLHQHPASPAGISALAELLISHPDGLQPFPLVPEQLGASDGFQWMEDGWIWV